MLIFAENISERLKYTLDFIFSERGLSYDIISDLDEFKKSDQAKLNYSNQEIEGVYQIKPSNMLFDEDIIVYGVSSGKFYQEECLSFNHIVDPIASIFYILSRMEEYSSYIEDEHGRFPCSNSVLNRFNWLDKVVCDRWSEDILAALVENAKLVYKRQEYTVTIHPTFDIDNAYAYRLKYGFRKWFSMARDLIKRDTYRLLERKSVMKGKKSDPYDTYDYILNIANRGFEVNMFWLLGDYAKYDKNVSHRDIRHQRLIRRMSRKTIVGIHPSYKSNSYEFFLLNEKERLEIILHRLVEHSRQHFLKLKIPVTYRSISTMGIKHDYTMGYAEAPGFRAGTARPFKWFDLNRNKISDLTIHPFVYMDGTLNEYMELEPAAAKECIQKLYNEVKKYGGDFVFIWHNETIGDYGKWKGWKDVLEYTLDLQNKK